MTKILLAILVSAVCLTAQDVGNGIQQAGGVGSGASSVGLSMPSTFCSVSNSPVTSTGTLTCTYATGQTANLIFGTNSSGNVGLMNLTTAQLPAIASTFLSDSSSLVRTTDTGSVTNTMLAGSIANGKLAIDPTNASNISSGTLGASRGGALVLLQTQTAAAAASLSFASCFSATYDEYKIEFIGITQGTSGATEILRFSTNGGSTYDSSSIYDWTAFLKQFGGTTDSSGETNANAISIWSDSSRVGPGSAATPGIVESMTVYDPLSASNYKAVVSQGIGHYNGGGVYYQLTLGGLYKSATAVNAFQILATSGTFSGTVRCYGIGH